MKILQLVAAPFPTQQGSQVYIKGLSGALVDAGHEVFLASYGAGRGTYPSGVTPVPIADMSTFVGHRSGPSWAKLVANPALVRSLVSFLRRQPIDLIHAHNIEAPVLARAAMAMAGTKIPLLYDMHTLMNEELPSYTAPPLMKRALARMGGRLDRAVVAMSDGVVSLSPRALAVARAWGTEQAWLCEPGVDPEELHGEADRARQGFHLPGGPLVTYTGNLDAYQDLDILLHAMLQLPDTTLVVVTHGALGDLHAAMDAVGLPRNRVHAVVTQRFQDVVDVLHASTVAVLPRTVCAGFPIKLLNCLGCGVPVVASAGSARPLEGVVAVPNRNIDAMAHAIRAVVRDPLMAERLGASAKRSVLAHHTWAQRAQAMQLTVYDPLLCCASLL